MRMPISAPTVAAAAKDGKVVEKRGGNGMQTFEPFQALNRLNKPNLFATRPPQVAPKVAW